MRGARRIAGAAALAAAFRVLLGCDSSDAASAATGASATASSSSGSAGAGGAGGEPLGAGGFPDACDKLCTTFGRLGGCGVASCEDRCPEWIQHAGDCALEMAREIDCIAESTTQCGQDVCREEFAALEACAGGVDCFGQACTGSSQAGTHTCQCATGCSTGRIRVECVGPEGGDEMSCECFVADRKVSECVYAEPFCDLTYTCCSRYF